MLPLPLRAWAAMRPKPSREGECLDDLMMLTTLPLLRQPSGPSEGHIAVMA
jgi:hypothetical protein